MPMPSSAQRADGALTVTPASGLSHFAFRYDASHDARLEAATLRMLDRLDRTCGGDVRRSALATDTSGATLLTIHVAGPGGAVQGVDEDESYTLKVTPEAATLTAATDVGAMHGMETLLQLATNVRGACVLPAISIEDTPRFRWRGFMLDVSRHFEPVPAVERQIDAMAVAKLNVFHWHLSEHQAFRAESKLFPKLTSVGSDGQFYTQDQMRAVVAYARARGIRVVPEFDMPGHATSWIVAYPELGSGEDLHGLAIKFGVPPGEMDPTSPAVYKFVDALVGEMGAIFPDAYFHIGGDEAPGDSWMKNPKIKAFMDKHGFTKPDELQAYFNQQLLPILKKHGKQMIGWDEILNPALPKNIVIQSWRGEASLSAGAKQGYQGILSAPYYLDGEKTSAQMFLADPIPVDTTLDAGQQKLILGGEVCMWAEQLDAETVDSRVWPRTLAIAERFWSPQNDRDTSYMYQRLRRVSAELEDVGVMHLAGPERLRRNLVSTAEASAQPETRAAAGHALDLLASVTEPFSFGERYNAQRTDARTSLDRLVDAVAADPPARQEIAGAVDALIGKAAPGKPAPHAPDTSGDVSAGGRLSRQDAMSDLRRRFAAWQDAVPALLTLAAQSPRMDDAGPLALLWGETGAVGTQALGYLDAKTAPTAEWTEHAREVLDRAAKGGALVHFAYVGSLRRLVDAAAALPAPQTAAMGSDAK
ncbi:beta-N-acetylhexosaminidase [Acidipila sp. EB88]|uniref:beta-N-acetylhexosaminidase n=1 Tax=Acidipila sp. EB88 TaxID=2305226 RepID=UPI001F173299|nr:family 20 glycosylhydrolase [Acidipila sp. EB88]